MSEKNPLSNDLPLSVERISNEIGEVNPVKRLVTLLKANKLSKALMAEEVKKSGVTTAELGYRILDRAGLKKDFIDYVNKTRSTASWTESDIEESIFSFLEKIQQKSEPEKVEEEIQLVGFPEIPKKTTTEQLKEEPKPVVIPQQEAVTLESPILESVQHIPEPPVELERPPLPKIWAEPEQVPAPISVPELILPTKLIEHIPQPERKKWWEVKRETEVMAVEDLDGDMKKFEKYVGLLGVAEKDTAGKWQWTGDDKKLVFLGDILGDRNMDGIEITSNIGNLAKQAELQGGQVDFLCGNHDMDFIRFLCMDGSDNYAEKNSDLLTRQSLGTWELAQLDPYFKKVDPSSDEFRNNDKKFWTSLYDKMPMILENMRNSNTGRGILESICRIKVALVHDDTLFCHTDPTVGMITDLTGGGDIGQRVSEINNIFQENLRRVLFDGGEFDGDFRNIEEIYLSALNRDYFVEQRSFDGLADNLLTMIVGQLYEKKNIVFSQDAYDDIGKNNHKNFKWEDWKRYLFNDLKAINIDEFDIENRIEEWRIKNGLSGEYMNNVINILNIIGKMPEVFDDNNKWNVEFIRLNELTELLAEKIGKENSPEDNIAKVRNSGINAIIHGHSPVTNRYYNKNDLLIVSPHVNFSGGSDEGIGVSIIKKNGRMKVGGKDFR